MTVAEIADIVTIALVGHYGHRNLGDEATIHVAIRSIAQRLPTARIVAVSANPTDTEKRHGIPSFPIRHYYGRAWNPDAATRVEAVGGSTRNFLKGIPLLRFGAIALRQCAGFVLSTVPEEIAFALRSLRFLREVDAIVIVGSQQLNDEWGGPWSHPFTLARWAVLARLAGARVAVMGVGAGPIDRPLSKPLFRLCLALSDYRSVRDDYSRDLLAQIGVRGEVKVYPDLAFGMQSYTSPRAAGDRRRSGRTVGINVMPVWHGSYWHTDNPERAGRYRTAIAQFASALRRDGHSVFFFSTQPKDDGVVADVMRAMDGMASGVGSPPIAVHESGTVSEIADLIASADIVVATRFHGALLPLALGVPTICISYYRKNAEVMKQMEQGAYVIELDDVDGNRLLEMFLALDRNFAVERNKIERIGESQRRSLGEQYDQVLGWLLTQRKKGARARRIGRAGLRERALPSGERRGANTFHRRHAGGSRLIKV